jgi:beta-N-acetylglucosaminidase/archaellum component FlaG (FlaF/FlaG flagellin family)
MNLRFNKVILAVCFVVAVVFQPTVKAEAKQVLTPKLTVDSPSKNALVRGSISINGWALNPSGMKTINILVDGKVKGQATLGFSRQDVNKAFPGYPGGDKSGYSYTLDTTSLSAGVHTIQVQAVGKNGTKVAQSVSIKVDKLIPMLAIENPVPNTVMKNNLDIAGWALNASGVKEINVLVDGKFVGQASLGFDRADVNNLFPGYVGGDKSGYYYMLNFDSVTMGDHLVTLQAMGNDNTKIEQSIKINRGNAFITYKNYEITLDEFIAKQMEKCPALQVKNDLGIYEWRYAKIQDGQEGYFIYVDKLDETGNVVTDLNGNKVRVTSFIPSPEQYQAIKQELINKINPEMLVLDSNQVYQFIKLSYNETITAADLDKLFDHTGVLYGKGQVFIDAAKQYNVNPLYLAAHSILETGNGKSNLSKGIAVNGITVFNLFGIGAVDSAAEAAGSQVAFNNGWDSIEKAIYGGAKWIEKGYISAGQDTIYRMRWNPENIYHQYATDIKWASNQTSKIKQYFDLLGDYKLIFEIPVFKK